MTTATPTLQDYRDRLGGVSQQHFIGSILWYSIAGVTQSVDGKRTSVPVRVTLDQLEEWMDELDLDKSALPPRQKKVDAFRRASSAATDEYDVEDNKGNLIEGQTAKLRVVEIDYNDEFVLRHVLRDVYDKRTQTTTTAHVATLRFNRGGRTAHGRRSSGEHYKYSINTQMVELGLNQKPTGKRYNVPKKDAERIRDLVATFDARYTDLCANLHSDAIREFIRRFLVSLNAISCKPTGGVYFIHSSRQTTLDNLQELVRRIGQGCTLHQLPLLDTFDQRDMLTEAFQTEVQDEVDRLLAKIAKANEASQAKGGKIRPEDYATFMDMYQDISSRSEEYTRVLGLAQGRAGSALELGLDAIMDMTTRLDTARPAKKK